MSLEGKVVLVTGGARGMGPEYVRAFLDEGGPGRGDGAQLDSLRTLGR
jgi:NAD(P)-dependent dehydrogenase (short-subunit alcohol dehydrogenase family)